MPGPIRTYLDASVILAYAKPHRASARAAYDLLRENRHLIASKLVNLETRAPSLAYEDEETLAYIDFCLGLIQEWLPIEDAIMDAAIALASETKSLAAADSIHLALCQKQEAIFANAEKPERAPNHIAGVRAHSIYVA